MKHHYLLFILTIAFINNSFAQEKKRNNIITANGGAIIGVSNISYERIISKRSSVMLSPSFSYLKSEGANYVTYGIGAGYRYYLSKGKTAGEGFFINPAASIAIGKASIEGKDEKTDVNGYSVLGFVGHQWIMKKGFTFNVGGGLQYLRLDYKSDNFAQNGFSYKGIAYSGILPGIIAGVGYAF